MSAQTDAGRIAGVVRDPFGAVVAGAVVVARNERTGEERTATTDAEGLYQFPALKASHYAVTVTVPNFAANTFKNVQLNVGQEQKLDVALTAACAFLGAGGGIALGLIMIPIVTRTTEEMLRLVPHSLRDRVLVLGGEAEAALGRSMYALVERDSAPAREVLAGDDRIDQLEVEIDRLCIDIFALRQPAARDLRFVSHLGRQDYAAPGTPRRPRLQHRASRSTSTTSRGSDTIQTSRAWPRSPPRCYARRSTPSRRGDAATARHVIERDDEIDVMYERLFRDLIELMVSEPAVTPRACSSSPSTSNASPTT